MKMIYLLIGCRITRHSFLLSKAIDKTFIYEYNDIENYVEVRE